MNYRWRVRNYLYPMGNKKRFRNYKNISEIEGLKVRSRSEPEEVMVETATTPLLDLMKSHQLITFFLVGKLISVE
jgi:hypothetical protein